MRRVKVEHGVATCILVDDSGVLRLEHHYSSSLITMRQAMSPRSLWPTINHADMVEIEEEERRARNEQRARRKAAKKASRRSRKIKRKAAA